jgi:hypothetical protein
VEATAAREVHGEADTLKGDEGRVETYRRFLDAASRRDRGMGRRPPPRPRGRPLNGGGGFGDDECARDDGEDTGENCEVLSSVP